MRDLSLMEKIQVINALIGFLFVYKMTVLPNAPDKVIHEVESIIKDFINMTALPNAPDKVIH